MPDKDAMFYYDPSAAPVGWELMAQSNPYYPYVKAQSGFQTLSGVEAIPLKVAEYLLDLEIPGRYTPQDDNTFPRCRFWKYLYYDDRTPLMNPLPTSVQKRQMFFDPERMEEKHWPDKLRGYRLYAQDIWGMAQGDQQTTVRISIGEITPRTPFKSDAIISIAIFTSPVMQLLRQGVTRTDGIVQSLIEALHGINMDGVGWFYFDRNSHPRCGVMTGLTDTNQQNVGAILNLGVSIFGV